MKELLNMQFFLSKTSSLILFFYNRRIDTLFDKKIHIVFLFKKKKEDA